MRKIFVITLAAMALSAGTAAAGGVSVGAFGGMSLPIVQEDQGNGSLYGVRVPVQIVPLARVEGFWSTSALGDKTVDVAGISQTRTGSDVTTFGVNAILTMGGFYPFAGIGSAKFKRDSIEDTYTSYHFGLGFNIPVAPKISVDLRGELQAAVKDGTSRKMGNLTLGVSYDILTMP